MTIMPYEYPNTAYLSRCVSASGAEPFSPHQFDTQQVITKRESIPRIMIMPEAYADMVMIAKRSGNDEVGWLGSVAVIGDNSYLLENNIFVPAQQVSASRTEMTEDGLSDLFTDMAMENPELCGKMMFWGHVHPSNSTSPSKQDEDQIELFNHNDWFIRGIFGRNGRAEFTFFDFKRGITWKDVPWQLYVPLDEDRGKYWDEQIAAKVSKAPVTVYNGVYPYHYGGGFREMDDETDFAGVGALVPTHRHAPHGGLHRPRAQRFVHGELPDDDDQTIIVINPAATPNTKNNIREGC